MREPDAFNVLATFFGRNQGVGGGYWFSDGPGRFDIKDLRLEWLDGIVYSRIGLREGT